MKSLFTLLMGLTFPLMVSAQKEFRRFSLGLGTGLANAHGDLRSSQAKNIYTGTADYFITPYLAAGAEVFAGSMAAHGLQSDRYFRSDFHSATGNVRLYFGRYLDRYRGPMHVKTTTSKVLEGIYAGVGLGFIKSSQKEINRKKDQALYRGWDTDRDAILPLSLGIDNSGFNPRIVTSLRAQFAFCFGDNIDGYAVSGSGVDKFSTLTASVKYRFGKIHTYYH